MTRREIILKPFEDEKELLEARVESGIEQHRKADAVIRVTDRDGKPVPGAKVKFALKKHEFFHGANIFMLDEMENAEKNEKYKEAFAKVFNLATLPFYWCDLEPVQGKERFTVDSEKVYRRPAPDLCLKYCGEKNITPKLHCLNYDQWTPTWMPMDLEQHKALLKRRIERIAERYAEQIPGMEVINETLCNSRLTPEGNRRGSLFFRESDLIEWSFKTARAVLPNNELIINEATEQAWDVTRGERSWYPLSIAYAMERGAEIDAIGLQYHMFYKKEDEYKRAVPFFSPSKLYSAMDSYYAMFGKPLQVTEITLPAYSNEAQDEELQADLLEKLYSIWFSHPAMEAVIYWNLVDGYAAFAPQGDMTAGENYYHGGLMRFDLTPKPAYERLYDLFHSRWTTNGEGVTDANGEVRFRGFKGEYEVEADGKKDGFMLNQGINGMEISL